MAKKRCENCGRFMRLTDLMPMDDELDEEAALQWGFSQAYIDQHWMDMSGALSGFRYVQDQWECDTCGTIQAHVEGIKHYWNAESGQYDALQPSPTDFETRNSDDYSDIPF